MRGRGRIILLGVCLIVYLTLCLLLAGHKLKRLDHQITIEIQTMTNRVLDYVFSFFTLLGSIEVTTLVILVLCWRLWKQGQSRAALVLFFLFVIGNVIEIAFKQRLEARPPELVFHRSVFGILLLGVKTPYSFPSGHLWRASFLALTLVPFSRARRPQFSWYIPFALILYVLVMAYSRIYLGEHWFSDVLGGIALGGMLFPFVEAPAIQTQQGDA